MDDSIEILKFIISVSAIASIISCIELLNLKSYFAHDNLFSWKIVKIELSQSYSKNTLTFLDKILKYPNIFWILYIQIISSFLILLISSKAILGLLCLIISLCYFLLSFRGFDGFNGGDSMNKVIFLSSCLGLLFSKENIVLYFIAFQLMFAYSLSGWFKATEIRWFNGTFLLNVLRQKTYSREFVWNIMKEKKYMAAAISTFIVMLECLCISLFFMPTEIQILYLIVLGVFHVMNALIMGLSAFVIPFLSCYPALIYTLNRL